MRHKSIEPLCEGRHGTMAISRPSCYRCQVKIKKEEERGPEPLQMRSGATKERINGIWKNEAYFSEADSKHTHALQTNRANRIAQESVFPTEMSY